MGEKTPSDKKTFVADLFFQNPRVSQYNWNA